MRRLLAPVTLAAIALTAACAPSQPTNPSGPGDLTVTPSGSDGSVAPSDGTGTLGTTEIPESALLTAEDVGPGYTATPWESALTDHGSLAMMMSYCGEGSYSEAGEHAITVLAGSVNRDEEHYVLERIVRYEATWAERHLSDLRAVLPRCTEIPVMGSDNIAEMTIIDTETFGDESLLIRDVSDDGTQFHAVIRQGDVEAELRIHTGGDEAQARDIAAAAAERLCAAESC